MILVSWPARASAQAEAPISIKIEGIEDKKIAQNARLFADRLQVSAKKLEDPFWQDSIIKTLSTSLEPFGYYNSDIVLSQPTANEVLASVTLNAPLRVTNITHQIIGEGRDDPRFKAYFDKFPLKRGDALVHSQYEAFKSDMFNYALANGYFDFYWQVTRLDLVRSASEANVALIGNSGQHYQFGPLVFVGESRAQALIERLAPFKAGDWYEAKRLTEFNQMLNQSGFFERVIARPLVSQAQGRQVPIEITLVHKAKDIVNSGIGIATDTGPRLRQRWQRPWVNDEGHSLSAEWFLSAPEQSLIFDYRIPRGDISNDYISIQAGYQFIDFENTASESETASVAIHRLWREQGSPWQRDLSLTWLSENFLQGIADRQTTRLLLPGFALKRVEKDDPLRFDKGNALQVMVQVGSEAAASDIDFVKILAESAWVFSHNRHRWSFRAQAGGIYASDFQQVPGSLRFFAGGDRSIRGFAFRDISPRDQVFDPEAGVFVEDTVGARYLATGSMEYSYGVNEQWRWANFIDTGTATNAFEEDVAVGVGTGVHWLSPIGPVRVYVSNSAVGYDCQSTLKPNLLKRLPPKRLLT
jgi:translocation and assembly module TamA